MSYDIEIKDLPAQLALAVHTRTSLEAIGQHLGDAFGAIMAAAAQTGAEFAGPPFCLYPAEVTAEFEVTVCMPVLPGATGTGDVPVEDVPGGTVASTLHKGSYSRLGDAYGALQAWMVANGKKPAAPCREVYVTEPDSVAEDEMLTEIDWPFV